MKTIAFTSYREGNEETDLGSFLLGKGLKVDGIQHAWPGASTVKYRAERFEMEHMGSRQVSGGRSYSVQSFILSGDVERVTEMSDTIKNYVRERGYKIGSYNELSSDVPAETL